MPDGPDSAIRDPRSAIRNRNPADSGARIADRGERIAGLGAWRDGAAARFRVWAPDHAQVDLVLEGGGVRDVRPLQPDREGYWNGTFADVAAGALYRYRLGGSDDAVFPDPASRFQPLGVHGPSQVVDAAAFRWTDHDWRPPRPEHLVFYELHVGTFSPDGTFRGVLERLPYLAQLGVNAIELMPVGDFPGCRNWGYDGVAIFAPARCYGTPDDLRRLVDAAHQHGLALFLDVVYNHFGPDGAYANAYSPYYFTDRHKSPWGQGVNLDGPHSANVRGFFIANALHWIREYHIDGLRLDATHALQDDSPTHFLREFSDSVRACAGRPVVIVAEDHRNLATMLLPPPEGGWGLDAVWADDFHHEVRVHAAGDREGYYEDFTGSTADLAATIRQGWFYTGQRSKHMDGRRGTDPARLELPQFVVCVQNHDQIGNRADGARLHHEVDAATFRAVSALLLVAPETPLLFQGQEWATDAPFLFFTDHDEELGRKVTEGRRAEFAAFEAFADPARREQIPDPQSARTFERSRLPWNELAEPDHAAMLRLYQRLLGLRATAGPLRDASRGACDALALDEGTVALVRRRGREQILAVVRLTGAGAVAIAAGDGARVLLTTEDDDVAPDPRPIAFTTRDGRAELRFARPGAAILQSAIRG